MTDTDVNQTSDAKPGSGGVGWRKLADAHGMGTRLYRCVAGELKPGSMNTRIWATTDNRAKVAELAKSILENTVFGEDGSVTKSGVLESIDAFNDGTGQMVIDSGETRWRAVRLLEGFDVLTGEAVEARVKPDMIWFQVRPVDPKRSMVDRRFDMILSNDGRDFTDLEYAAQIKELLTGDPDAVPPVKPVPQQEIASRLGREATWVSHINKLNHIVPEALFPFLREGQTKTTTVIDAIEEFGAEKAVESILAEIEVGKGQAAVDYQEAMADARVSKAKVEHLIATGTGQESISTGPGRKPPTTLELEQRNLAAATNRAGKAKEAMEKGPARVTGRAVRARATGTAPSAEGAPTAGNGKVSKANYAALLDAVRFAATNTAELAIRDAMNDALKRCGHPIVEVDPLVKPEGEDDAEVTDVAESAAEVAAETGSVEGEAVSEQIVEGEIEVDPAVAQVENAA